jgi:hypothetical protein
VSHLRATQTDIASRQQIYGWLRILGAGFLALAMAFWGAFRFESWDLSLASESLMKDPLGMILAVLLSPASMRYYVAPLAATVGVFLWAGAYIRDIYALPQLRLGLKYVISSMTALNYPTMVIDGGTKKIPKGEINLLDVIGGPGYVHIHPGNAVLFRKLRQPSNITLRETYFMAPFETIGQIASLEEQQGSRDGVKALTRDGIRVTVGDIHYRYRLFPELEGGKPKRRTLQDPYPFDEKALWNMAYNLAVDEKGLEAWKTAVSRAIVGGITDYINAHDIDALTAPREAGQDPRRELRYSLFHGPTRTALRNLGAELIYVDVGHFAIDSELVDEQRTETWAADWLGNAQVVKAYGEAKRLVYQELGRAEAQAELIMAIANALENADMNGNNAVESVRTVLLTHTSQLLETLAESSKRELGKGVEK